MHAVQAFVLGVAPCASSDIGVLLGAEGLESSTTMRGGAEIDEGPRGEGQGTLLQVAHDWVIMCHSYPHHGPVQVSKMFLQAITVLSKMSQDHRCCCARYLLSSAALFCLYSTVSATFLHTSCNRHTAKFVGSCSLQHQPLRPRWDVADLTCCMRVTHLAGLCKSE